MSITLEQAKSLQYRQTLYHSLHRNADGTPQRWRVNGKVKTWKRSPGRVQVPVKYGLHGYDYLTEHDLDVVCLDEDVALGNIFRVNEWSTGFEIENLETGEVHWLSDGVDFHDSFVCDDEMPDVGSEEFRTLWQECFNADVEETREAYFSL